MENRTYYFDQIPIHYQVTGSGAPVILIHGFGEDSTIFKHQVAHLSKHYQVITFDLPGIGKSGYSEELGHWDIDDYANMVSEFIEMNFKIPVTVIGHSMGGYITLSLVQQNQILVNGFGLLHSSALADNEEKIEAREKNIDFIEKYGSEKFIATVTPNLYAPANHKKMAKEIQEHIDQNKNVSPEALIGYTRAMIKRTDKTAFLKQTTLPVLWIIGVHDQAVKYEASLKQVYLSNISLVNILHQSGHMGMIEEPDRTNFAIEEFLNYIYRT